MLKSLESRIRGSKLYRWPTGERLYIPYGLNSIYPVTAKVYFEVVNAKLHSKLMLYIMQNLIVSLPLFISVIALYFYVLSQNKDKKLRFAPYILFLIIIETSYFTYRFAFEMPQIGDRIITPPWALLIFSLFFMLHYEIINKERLSLPIIIITLFPVIVLTFIYFAANLELFHSYLSLENQYWMRYSIGGIFIVTHSIILSIRIRKKITIRAKFKRGIIVFISLFILLGICLIFILLFNFYFSTFYDVTFVLIKFIEIIFSLVLYHYYVEQYRNRQLKEKEERLFAFNSLSELSLTDNKSNGVSESEILINHPDESIKYLASGKYKKSSLSPYLLREYKDKINDFFENNDNLYLETEFNMKKLSHLTNIPNNHLSQVFNIGMNTSFTQFLNERRIVHACKLIKDTGNTITVSELCFQCGYASKSTFYKQFKIITGKSFTIYRNQTS
mgnify:CR=1 FL=1